MSYNIMRTAKIKDRQKAIIGRKPQLQDKATGEYRREQDTSPIGFWLEPDESKPDKTDALQKAITGR